MARTPRIHPAYRSYRRGSLRFLSPPQAGLSPRSFPSPPHPAPHRPARTAALSSVTCSLLTALSSGRGRDGPSSCRYARPFPTLTSVSPLVAPSSRRAPAAGDDRGAALRPKEPAGTERETAPSPLIRRLRAHNPPQPHRSQSFRRYRRQSFASSAASLRSSVRMSCRYARRSFLTPFLAREGGRLSDT